MPKELDYRALGARIRKAREHKGLTQEQLSEECSLSPSFIGHIERGTRTPSLETVYAISCVLDVGLDELVFGSVTQTESLFADIAQTLHKKDPAQVERFMLTVRVLAAHVDEM